MSFNFGTPASSAASGQSTTTTAPASGGLFGSAAGTTFSFGKPAGSGTSTPQTGGGLFGQTPASTGQAGGLFGNAGASTTPSTSAPSTSTPLFGQQAGATSGGSSLFGNASKPTGALFGNTSTPATGTATPTGTPNLFGNKPAATTATTAAPSTGTQGATTGGLFGSATTAPQSADNLWSDEWRPIRTICNAGYNYDAGSFDRFYGTGSGRALRQDRIHPSRRRHVVSLWQRSACRRRHIRRQHSYHHRTGSSREASLWECCWRSVRFHSYPCNYYSTRGIFGNHNSELVRRRHLRQHGGCWLDSSHSAAPASASNLFAKPASTTAPSTTATTTATAPATTTAAATTSAPATTGLFGGAKPAGTTTTPAQDGKSSTAATLSASTMGPTSQLPRLKNKTMDEIITRWATDLSKYQKEFKEQAAKIAEWDRMLVDNGEKIQKLYTSTYEAERASSEIERQLSNVESQQEELAAWLDRYEADLDELFAKQGGGGGGGEQVGGPDQERERTYKLAEKLTDRLDDMGKDLTKMIKEINDMSSTLSKGSKPDDPLTQIVRVLNGHLAQLQWIDSNAAALQAKVAAAQKASGNMGPSVSSTESDAAESFYRSYRGGYR
ncbi:1a8f0d2b-737e-4960-a2db-3b83b889a1e4 [Thermothielavioides terrestris]|uniref:Nucleoporin NSP1 n=1 Tax=Thermothielavioides terrestris TaxID=2587410 RepID=A0A3S4B0J6_9PEZI|nr:1a8f0d2b-737e-4960-a2db-3b83b889a1e4 [Thermothielavioides terrestris]